MLVIQKEIRSHGTPEKARISQSFFKTGKGQYGEGDLFLGLTVPLCRSISKKYDTLKREDVLLLLSSKFHEERLIALMIMCAQYAKGNRYVVSDYLKHTQYVNNWDLVDTSAYKLINDEKIVFRLVKSKNMWEQRIAMVATYSWIKKGEIDIVYTVADMLLGHTHDLIHKAVGWMLREAGKKDVKRLEMYIEKNYKRMSRTTLRYAIEKFSEGVRKRLLSL